MNPVEPTPRITHHLLATLRSRAARVAMSYAAFATLWILFSDHALGLFITDPERLMRWSVYKGLVFVVLTSGLLLLLMRRAFGAMETGYAVLQAQQAEIERLNRLYAALSHISQAIVRMPTQDELLQRVCQVLMRDGGFSMAWVGWNESESNRLVPAAVAGDENDYVKNIQVYTDERPEGRACICNDLLNDPATLPWRPELARRALRSSAALPIRLGGKVAGILNVYSNTSGVFRDREIALLEAAAMDVSFALDNLAREAERQRAEARAQNERQFSDTMIESMPGVVYFYDAQGRFLRWNQNFETVSGYSGDEIARMHPLDFFAPADHPLLEARSAEVFNRGESSVEAPLVAKDGRVTPYFFTGRRVLSNGQPCLLGVGIDVSERRQAEVALRESLARFHAAARATNDAVWDWNLAANTIWWSENFRAFFGYRPEEIEPGIESWTERLHPEDKERVVAGIHAVIEGAGLTWSDEYRFRRGDGTYAEIFDRGYVLRDEAGRGVRMVGAIQDITERKRAEAALRESEHRYRTTLDNILEGCQLIGFDWRYLYLNDAAAVHNRRPKAELLGRTMPEIWPGIEQTAIFKVIERCLKDRTPAQEEVEFAFADGTKGWFETRAQPAEEGVLVLSVERTERKRAEIRLAESERKYRELVEHANSIILRWNSEGRITLLNEFGLRFFGYSAGEIIGRHVLDTIVPATESSGRDLRRLMDQICADPKVFEQNVNENVRRNGEHVWISWTNRIVQDDQGRVVEILSIGTDITAQRQANEALRRSEEQFRLIMENLADLVAVLDLDGRRLYNSPSYQGILGDPDRLLGSSSFLQVHPDDQARVRQTFEDTVRTGTGHRLEYRLVDQHGQPRHIESQGSVIRDAQGHVAQVVVVSRDVTERRQAELALRVLNQTLELEVSKCTADLRAALVRAEAADRLKSAFLATMSHELRTPLNSIIGFTGIVLQGLAGPLNPEQTKQLGMVRGSARHLLELINDVLDISKIEAGQLEVHAEPFDLPASIERVTASVKPQAEKKGLELTSHIPADLKEMVSDRRRVEQILLNLLNNALKFTNSGRVTLTVETIADFRPSPDAPPRPAVRLRVTDTGIGIRPEDLQLLFQPFRQLDTGLTRQHDGTGLGLAICRRLAGLLGGEISAQSQWQHGSEFTVVLPLKGQGEA